MSGPPDIAVWGACFFYKAYRRDVWNEGIQTSLRDIKNYLRFAQKST